MQSPGLEGLELVRCLHVLLMLRLVPQKAFMLWSVVKFRPESWILTVKMREHKHSEPHYYGAEKWTTPNTMKA